MTRLLLAAVLAGGAPPARAAVVDDVTRLNPVAVDRVVVPRSVAEVQRLVRSRAGPISIGGGGFSQGGQTRTEGALMLDMRGMDRVLALDVPAKTITVEAGITWREIQEAIDPHGLSLSIMQSYSNFTVGGSLSVDCHGRYVNQGPLVLSVKSIKIVLADGRVVEASPAKNSDVFYGAIGGYGGLGVIVEATLRLADNARVAREHKKLPVEDYRRWFFAEIRGSTTAVFHNGDIYPPDYDVVMASTYRRTEAPLTVKERLVPRRKSYWREKAVYWLISEGPLGKYVREYVVDPLRLSRPLVEWRNHEASYDVAELEPASRKTSTYVLQEYFVPVERFDEFVPKMREVFRRYRVNVMNVSIRHARQDPGTLLAWARRECFAFVVYYKQGVTPAARTEVGLWTRELIDAVESVDGTYYLPYQPVATDAQFRKAYPRAGEYFALKKRLDPTYKFRNKLWDRYLPPPPDPRAAADAAIAARLAARKTWTRAEDRTFLALPEWYVVYSADELADFLTRGLPSRFPYMASVRQFWGRAARVRAVVRGTYPRNRGYDVMILAVGASFTAQYALKAAYEDTLGRLTERVSLGRDPGRGGRAETFMAGVARDYAAFVHDSPWYEFPFWTRLKTFVRAPDPGAWTVRRLERDVEVPVELFAQAAWGKAIKTATKTAYAPAEHAIEAWVRPGGADVAALVPGAKVLERFGKDDQLIVLPRHESFTRAALVLAAHDVRFLEIAGDRRILLTVVAPVPYDGARLWGDVVDEWPVLTRPGRKRVAVAVPVADLTAALRGLPAEGAEIDHVYDY